MTLKLSHVVVPIDNHPLAPVNPIAALLYTLLVPNGAAILCSPLWRGRDQSTRRNSFGLGQCRHIG